MHRSRGSRLRGRQCPAARAPGELTLHWPAALVPRLPDPLDVSSGQTEGAQPGAMRRNFSNAGAGRVDDGDTAQAVNSLEGGGPAEPAPVRCQRQRRSGGIGHGWFRSGSQQGWVVYPPAAAAGSSRSPQTSQAGGFWGFLYIQPPRIPLLPVSMRALCRVSSEPSPTAASLRHGVNLTLVICPQRWDRRAVRVQRRRLPAAPRGRSPRPTPHAPRLPGGGAPPQRPLPLLLLIPLPHGESLWLQNILVAKDHPPAPVRALCSASASRSICDRRSGGAVGGLASFVGRCRT